MGVLDKKHRQLQSTLDRLVHEHLVDLPHVGETRGKHEGFILMSDDGSRLRTNTQYRVPEVSDSFPIPLSLVTNGWIFVLEDSELSLLLIAARLRHKHGDLVHRLSAGPRLLNYGLSRDAFEAHSMLDWLGLLEVHQDPDRDFDGKVTDFATRGAQPHGLRLLLSGLDRPALETTLLELQRRIDRS